MWYVTTELGEHRQKVLNLTLTRHCGQFHRHHAVLLDGCDSRR